MTLQPFLQLNRLRVMRRGYAAYDQEFHEGVNIIRGQNGSGKSTVADFIFFALGGEFDDWKEAASQCDEVQAEIETPRGNLVLKRQIEKSDQPVSVFFGSMADAEESALDGWEQFRLRRYGGRESFSQIMFRSLLIPEAQSDGASNITMHQLLRLCYSDQRTPATRLFRFESFDTQNIREAVGNLLCGISGYELYEIGLALREKQKDFDRAATRLSGLLRALSSDEALHSPELIHQAISKLEGEKSKIQSEIDQVDSLVESGQINEYLGSRKLAQRELSKQRGQLQSLESELSTLEFELREIQEFLAFLSELTEKLSLAEITYDAVGTIDFTHCPACGEQLNTGTPTDQCVVCKSPRNPEQEKSRYNQIRLDLEIQTRESRQLIDQKRIVLENIKQELRKLGRYHKQELEQFDLMFAGGNGPREAFLAKRTNRIGHIDAEIAYLLDSLETAEEIARLSASKAALQEDIDIMGRRAESLQKSAGKRRSFALSKVSNIASTLLRSDLPRQDEFLKADGVALNFQNDSVTVNDRINFAESSNVYLKNTAIFSLFLAATMDKEFYHPKFLLFDNIEDKGMEENRSHNFQRLIVEHATNSETNFQVIFTTSMMNPDLELEDYVIGPAYTKEQPTLDLGYQRTV